MFEMDEGVRVGTSWKYWQNYALHFNVHGSVTAGNASQTSDGAGAVLVMDREVAEAQGLKPIAKFRSFAVGGVATRSNGNWSNCSCSKSIKTCRFIH